MQFALMVFGAATFIELALWLPPLWHLRKIISSAIVPVLSLSSGLLFGWDASIWTGLILIFSAYRVVNLLRVLEGRLQSRYLHRSTMLSAWWLVGCQLVVLGTVKLAGFYRVSDMVWLYAVATVQLIVALMLWLSTRRHLRTTRLPVSAKNLADKELPTLTVAIPARNESDDLEACLRSLIASDYPKLEILVLDDCSQNKRTPGIIRDFAQSGVRFIAGQTPPQHWLAKNYAYHQLAQEASGEVLLFCGVDTRFEPATLRLMVESLIQKRKVMVSFIPRNQLPPSWSVESLLVQPARYAWELSPPRRMFKRPPVLSTCWLIVAESLQAAGGFEAVTRSISPESYFARWAANHKDGYSFMQTDQTIDLGSAKNLSEQRATAVRTRYPQLHRRPELVAFSAVGELAALVWPFALAVAAGIGRHWALFGLAAATSLLLVSFYAKVVQLTYRRFLWRGLWTLPLVAIYDIGLLNYSMWRYEFREVIWKDRNICVPVMQRVTEDLGKRL